MLLFLGLIMINIVVRSKRDVDAVKAMLNNFYREWSIKVYSLHGARSFEDVVDALDKIVSPDEFYVILLGREDQNVVDELNRTLPMNATAYTVPRARVRNTRIEHLAHIFDLARSMFRLAVTWDNEIESYVFGLRKGIMLEGYEYNPAYDVFIGIGRGFTKVLEKVLGTSICLNPVLVRKFGGLHDIYCGFYKVAELEVPDNGFKPNGRVIKDSIPKNVDMDSLLKANNEVLRIYEHISKKFLRRFIDWVDTVIVPWSGGKDSTAALLLTLEVFPRSKVKVLFSDTGTEFPWTIEYVEEVSRKLGIEVVKVYAGIDRGLLEEGMPMPTHDNRWCTGRKITSVTLGLSKLSSGNTLIVTGDRDAESRRRSVRPPIRIVDKQTLVATPLKLWSAAHVQLYILWKGLPLNPLYERGFYRIGCYICPALRSWELYIMVNDPLISSKLKDYPLYHEFLKHRMKLQFKKARREHGVACDYLSICG